MPSLFHRHPKNIGERLDKTWRENKGTILGVSGGMMGVGLAARLAESIHKHRLAEQARLQHEKEVGLSQSALQNQAITVRLLSDIAARLPPAQ